MFKITKSTSPKNGKPGRLQICEVNGEFVRVLIDIETKVARPYKYAVKYKTGKFAKLVRHRLIEAGISDLQCDIILRTGIYDPRNGRKRHATPEQLLSEQRRLQAKIQHAVSKSNT
ncbi:TPA: hypothetical protein ACX3EJ_004989 [Vibrio parahaemolyticus]|nr:hypothetical protein BTZ53_10640 [Vibrio parahaemolyticus]